MDRRREVLPTLLGAFWGRDGWLDPPRWPSKVQFEAAKAAGVMFDAAQPLSHDEVVSQAIASRGLVSKDQVAAGFVHSLSSRLVDLRSALGSYAALLHLEPHPFQLWPGSSPCSVCGARAADEVDRNVFSFERFKWGGVRHEHPSYASFDLDQLDRWTDSSLMADPVEVQPVLQALSALPPTARAGDAAKALASVVKSNAAERQVLVGVLGLAGVLQPRHLPSMRTTFVPYKDRNSTARLHPGGRTDWKYPMYSWCGADGVNADAAQFWFGPAALV